MNNPFEGKAVKFETAEQLEHLAELARGCGLTAVGYDFNLFTHRHFREHFDGKEYSNYRGTNNLPEIHYSDFIKNIEAAKFTDSITKDVPDPIARPEQPDMVNHPPHYTVNGIEVIDVIEGYKLNYRLGNVVKYVLRSDLKGNRLQDLKKALWYLQREIEQSEKQK